MFGARRDRKKARAQELERKVVALDGKFSEVQVLRNEIAHLQEVNQVLEQAVLERGSVRRSSGGTEGGGGEEGSRDSNDAPRLVQVCEIGGGCLLVFER